MCIGRAPRKSLTRKIVVGYGDNLHIVTPNDSNNHSDSESSYGSRESSTSSKNSKNVVHEVGTTATKVDKSCVIKVVKQRGPGEV